jgi:hypothetical protein
LFALYSTFGFFVVSDLAILLAGGFVDNEPSSQGFGNFTVGAQGCVPLSFSPLFHSLNYLTVIDFFYQLKGLNLYNADEGVNTKLKRLKEMAIDSNAANVAKCDSVLSDLFSACDPDERGCTNPNVQSFDVSINQVCAAVNTPKKLLFEVVGDEFDGFIDKFIARE